MASSRTVNKVAAKKARPRMVAVTKQSLKREETIHSYDDEFLACRDLRHPWKVVGYFRDHKGNIRRELQCSRCPTKRTDVWKANGDRITNQYAYPKGYVVEDGLRPIEVRREIMRRVTVYENYEQMIEAVFTNRKKR